MSLYSLFSMNHELSRRNKPAMPHVTDSEWKTAEDLLRSVTLNDPSVRVD